jgi:hypothetical protein
MKGFTEYRHTSERLQVRFQFTAIKRVTRSSWFPTAYKSYVYTTPQSIKCAIALCIKNNVHTLIKNTFAKNANHHPSFQRVVMFLLMEGLALMLMAAGLSGWGC